MYSESAKQNVALHKFFYLHAVPKTLPVARPAQKWLNGSSLPPLILATAQVVAANMPPAATAHTTHTHTFTHTHTHTHSQTVTVTHAHAHTSKSNSVEPTHFFEPSLSTDRQRDRQITGF